VTAAPLTGLLVITLCMDETATEPRLKVVSTTDVIGGTEHRIAFTGTAEIPAYVRCWLSDVGDAVVTAPRRRPVSVVRHGRTGGNPGRGDR
jgi:hypothetical protein